MLSPTSAVRTALLIAVFLSPHLQALCPPADLNTDCTVDFQDLALFADNWLRICIDPQSSCPNFNTDDQVNIFDYARLAENWHHTGHPLMINELMASNTTVVADELQQYDDWAELFNASDNPIDLAGMYLTDDLNQPTKWQFPLNQPQLTTIAPHGYLWLWLDDSTGTTPLHANFKLDAASDCLALFDTDGRTLIDVICFDNQSTDISYGRYPDGTPNWRFLAIPTPSLPNQGAYIGQVAPPRFSHQRGFYDEPFTLTIATETEGAFIYYTTDGRVPYEKTGRFPAGTKYTGPIPITHTIRIRARALKPGYKPSPVVTHTYFLNATAEMRSLPAISLVGDERKPSTNPTA